MWFMQENPELLTDIRCFMMLAVGEIWGRCECTGRIWKHMQAHTIIMWAIANLTPLIKAVEANTAEETRWLIEEGVDLDCIVPCYTIWQDSDCSNACAFGCWC